MNQKFNNHIENEWIYSPDLRIYEDENDELIDELDAIYPEDFSKENIEKANKKLEKYTVSFNTEEVKYIILNSFSDLKPMIDFLKQKFKPRQYYDLMSKIITIEQLKEDF